MGIPIVFANLGPHMINGDKLNRAIANPLLSYQDGITAFAGGGQTGAVLLSARVNRVSTVATAADSVMLPMSQPGAQVQVINSSANSMQVFANGQSSLQSGVLDTINGTAGATGVAVAAGKTAIFTCYSAGAWVGPVALA